MKEIVKNILCNTLEMDEDVFSHLNEESNLVDFGLDSLKAIEIVVQIENMFDVIIEDDDLILDNLDCIQKIYDLILKYKN